MFRIPGFGHVRTRADFMADPAAQEAANQAHRANLAREIAARGLARFVGQTIGGVPVTQEAIMAGMHFAGPGGMTRFLETGGVYDPSDGNLRLTQYLARAGGGGAGGPMPSIEARRFVSREIDHNAVPGWERVLARGYGDEDVAAARRAGAAGAA